MSRIISLCFSLILILTITSCQKEVLISDNDYKTLGSSANQLLSADKFTSLVVEVAYMPGYEPDVKSIDELHVFLRTFLNKPEGIQIITKQVFSSGNSYLNLKELVAMEKASRKMFSYGQTMAVYILIADAGYSVDQDILGLSYWNTSICLFGKRIFESSGRLGQVSRSRLFSTLLQHEFGHLLGLVGQGSPMQSDHLDNDKGAHCTNPACLMYYGVETVDNLNVRSSIPKLDAQCMADLKANGGK